MHILPVSLSSLKLHHTASLVDHEEDWDDDDEPAMALDSSRTHGCSSFNSPPQNYLMEKAEDFLLADDPAQFSDEFSDPDEWDVS